MDQPYLIRKGGMYYGHNSCGYVSRCLMAEIYTKEYAEGHAKNHEGIDAVPISEVISLNEIYEVLERINAIREYLEDQSQ